MPPTLGVAVMVTLLPKQNGFEEGAMLTAGVTVLVVENRLELALKALLQPVLPF